MEIILKAISGFYLAWLFIDVLRIPERYKQLNLKPFNCIMCLSFWSAGALFFLPYQLTLFIFITTTAAIIGAWMEART